MYTPEDSPFEKFRTEKLKGVAMSPDVLELVAKAYEGGFIDGMQKQMQSSVDRAVNRMAEQPAQHERVQPDSECKEDDGCPTEKAVLQRFWRKAQQQEPVAIYRAGQAPNENYHVQFFKHMTADEVLLYTSPPASKPLTDAQIDLMTNHIYHRGKPVDRDYRICLFREAEAAHGIKGDA